MTRSIERTAMSASKVHRYDPGDGPRDRSLRVGDAERDAVGEILRQRHLEGRLDAEEFQARLEASLAAKTYADLDALIADLPTAASERRPAEQPWARGLAPLPLLLLPLALLAAVVAGAHVAWLAFPLFFFVLRPLAWRSWGPGYGRAPWGCGPRRGA
jgi:hypothetical protein